MTTTTLHLIVPRTTEIFGVSWGKGSSPTLTRTDSAVGMTAAVGALGGVAAANSFDRAPIFSEIVEVTDTLGNVFVRIPKFYIAKTDGVGYRTIRISKTQHPGFYLPAVFWDFTNGHELAYFDFGKYKASSGGTTLDSKASTFPLINQNIVTFRTRARANNTGGLLGYQQLDVHAHDVLSALFTVEFATLNSQAIMSGFTAGQWSDAHAATVAETGVNRIIVANATADAYRVGQSVGIGTASGSTSIASYRLITAIEVYDASNKAMTFDGAAANLAVGNVVWNMGWQNGFATGPVSGYLTANDGKYPCAYRGIESPGGDVWQFVDGVNFNDYQAWVTPDAADYASNVFASPYVQLGYVDSATSDWTKFLGFDAANPYAEFPTEGGGGGSYYGDYYYTTAGQRIAVVGGSWSYGSLAGLRYWSASFASSVAGVDFGGRLLRKAL